MSSHNSAVGSFYDKMGEHEIRALILEVDRDRAQTLLRRYYNCVVAQEGHDYLDAGHFTEEEIAEIIAIVIRKPSDFPAATPENLDPSDC